MSISGREPTSSLVSVAEGIALARRDYAAERRTLRRLGYTMTTGTLAERAHRDEERRPLIEEFIGLVTAAEIAPQSFRRWDGTEPIGYRLPHRVIADNAPRSPWPRLLRPRPVQPAERIGWEVYDQVSGGLGYDTRTTKHLRHSYLYVTRDAEIIESDVADDYTQQPPLTTEAFAHSLATFLVNNGLVEAPDTLDHPAPL